MLLIPCPWCGSRAQTEFAYGGDAKARRPADPDAVFDGAWLDYVYLRTNPCGPHAEFWYHRAGCRRWFKVLRDTMTQEVLASAAPHAPLGEDPR